MSSEIPNSAPWSRQLSHHSPAVDTLAKGAAAGLALVYVAGFLVISIHEAGFGVVSGEILRARAVAAGLALAAFASLSALGAISFFASPLGTSSPKEDGVLMFVALTFWTFPTVLPLLFADSPIEYWSGTFLRIGLIALGTGVVHIVLLKKTFPFAEFVRILTWSIAIGGTVWAMPLRVTMVTGWIAATGLVCTVWRPNWQGLAKSDGVRQLISFVAWITLYVAAIHGQLYPYFGGGAPVPVIVHFREVVPPWNEKLVETQVVSETDTGLYVLQAPYDGTGKRPLAVFVPRDAVASVLYRGYQKKAQSRQPSPRDSQLPPAGAVLEPAQPPRTPLLRPRHQPIPQIF